MWFHSLYAAGYDALLQLYIHVPDVSDDMKPEWGTVIYRVPFEGGGHGYTYQTPYISKVPTKWSPRGDHMFKEYDSEVVGYCHCHPNPTFFSSSDTSFVESNSTVAFMCNQKGGYWYDATDLSIPKQSRYGKFWGKY